jgi:hypothetical protein
MIIMKKTIPILVVLVLVLSVIGIARGYPVWAGPKSTAGEKAPLKTLMTITSNGTYNIGGVCEVTATFKTTGNTVKADAEVQALESLVVPFSGDGNLLYPGCHFAFFKGSNIVSPASSNDVTLKVCFGASPELQMQIYYYLDNAGTGGRVWTPLPSTVEDSGRLICAPAIYSGVYMPAGKVVPPSGLQTGGTNPFFPKGASTGNTVTGGTVITPDPEIVITKSGTYPVGGVCLITATYDTTGLSDTVQVAYPTKHYVQDTLTVPFGDYANGDLLYFPGCHVVHYKNQQIQDQMNTMNPKDGEWQICFAAIPDKTMTIYYYNDNLTQIKAPWTALATKTENGMACADLVDFSAVYAPAGK